MLNLQLYYVDKFWIVKLVHKWNQCLKQAVQLGNTLLFYCIPVGESIPDDPRTSDIIETINEPSSTEKDGLTTFKGAEETETETQLGLYKVPLPQSIMSTDMKEFLERPVKVYTFSWETTGLRFTFDPLDLYLQQQNIARKLSNFLFLRAKGLRIKMVSTGTPYMFGRYGIGWWPYRATDPYSTIDNTTAPRRVSCLPFYFEVDPSKNQTQEITVPWFTSGPLKLNDAVTIGYVQGTELAPLSTTVTGALTLYCTLTFYVSLIDPELSVPTSKKTYYATSAEYKGVISKPLQTVAKFSDFAAKVPLLAPYATAAGEAAKMGAKVASWFGYSKPPTTVDPTTIIPRAVGTLSTTEGLDTANVFTFSKTAQSVVDPSVFGLPPKDELVISDIVSRYSLATSVTWTDSDEVDTIIATQYVGPFYGYTGTYPCAQTHIGYVSSLFNSWRGTIIIKLVFCVSQFHTGRIQIFYDKNSPLAGEPTGTTLNWIVDLKDQQEIELELPWTHARAFQGTGMSDNLAGYDGGTDLPRLSWVVVSRLRAGQTATSIKVLAYVKAGKDYELAEPTLLGTRNGSYQIVNFPAAVPAAALTGPYKFYGTSGTTDVARSELADNVFTGQSIVSLRPLLKRYQVERLVSPDSGTVNGANVHYFCCRDYPNAPGPAVSGNGVTAYQNTVPHNAMTWFGPSFVGYRGSIKSKLVPISRANYTLIATRVLQCANYMAGKGRALNSATTLWNLGDSLSGSEITMPIVHNDFGGNAYCTGSGNALEWQNHYTSGGTFIQTGTTTNDSFNGLGVLVTGFGIRDTVPNTNYLLYKAIGDDFMYLYYKGPPILYQQSTA